MYPCPSASEVKWHFGQVNCIIGRDDQDGFTMFNAIGHALHFGHAINTASGARSEVCIRTTSPRPSRGFASIGHSRPASAHPMWHRRTVTVAAAYPGRRPCDDGTQQQSRSDGESEDH